MLVLKTRAKNLFFDRTVVSERLSAAKRKSLSRAGAVVRRQAMRSTLRKGKRPSPPGKPPKVHTNDPVASLRYILFHYEPDRDTVIVGPVGLRPDKQTGRVAPETMEHGGEHEVTEWALADAPIVGRGRQRRGRTARNIWTLWTPDARSQADARARSMGVSRRIITRRRHVVIYPRKFMEPTMLKVRRKFPNLFLNSIRA
jgi:hypothetical protein